MDISTRYMGIELKNPFVASASSLTGTIESVRRCAKAGAGAIVLKSLFEEQIAAETDQLSESVEEYSGYGEALDYIRGYGMELGPREYLNLVSESKNLTDVPIIASLNCITSNSWGGYAKKLEAAGADGLELNISIMPNSIKQDGTDIIDAYLRIVYEVKQRVKIPVAVKVGSSFTSFGNFADRLATERHEAPAYSVGWMGKDTEPGAITWKGVDALVLFNRFYKFDIDIQSKQLVHGQVYSTQSEISDSLRWISLLAGKISCDLACNTGVHDGRDAAKALLAGAQVVEFCSTLFINGLPQISTMIQQLCTWMEQNNYEKLSDFRGLLSQNRSKAPEDYERQQYIKTFVGLE
jgi:dihydroorotate dehydrogenase (fumarate)